MQLVSVLLPQIRDPSIIEILRHSREVVKAHASREVISNFWQSGSGLTSSLQKVDLLQTIHNGWTACQKLHRLRVDPWQRNAMPLYKPPQTILQCISTRCVDHWIKCNLERPARRGSESKSWSQNIELLFSDPCRHSHPEDFTWLGRSRWSFVLNKRINGQTLEEAWTTLSESQKIDIADQVVEVRKQLWFVMSTSIQCVDQSPCYPGLLYFDL